MIEIDDDVLHCLSASARKRLRDDSQMGRLLMEIVDLPARSPRMRLSRST